MAVLLLFRAHFTRDTPDFKHQVGITLWKTVADMATEILESLVNLKTKKTQVGYAMLPTFPTCHKTRATFFRESVLLCMVPLLCQCQMADGGWHSQDTECLDHITAALFLSSCKHVKATVLAGQTC